MPKQSHELKSLQVQLTTANRELNELHEEAIVVKGRIGAKKNTIANIKQKISKMEKKDVIVTEHALLRYVERYFGVNLDEIKDQILSNRLETAIWAMGDGKYPIPDTEMVAIVQGNKITSIVPA